VAIDLDDRRAVVLGVGADKLVGFSFKDLDHVATEPHIATGTAAAIDLDLDQVAGGGVFAAAGRDEDILGPFGRGGGPLRSDEAEPAGVPLVPADHRVV